MSNVQTLKEAIVDPQGSKANKNGQKLEHMVEAELCKYDIESLYYTEELDHIPEGTKGLLFKNVPYTTVYGSRGRGEFVLSLLDFPDIRIECRSQSVAGSVDEKLPYLLENCKAFEEEIVIVVLEGNGYKTRAKEWFIENAHAVRFKDINVMSFKEFKNWTKGLLG